MVGTNASLFKSSKLEHQSSYRLVPKEIYSSAFLSSCTRQFLHRQCRFDSCEQEKSNWPSRDRSTTVRWQRESYSNRWSSRSMATSSPTGWSAESSSARFLHRGRIYSKKITIALFPIYGLLIHIFNLFTQVWTVLERVRINRITLIVGQDTKPRRDATLSDTEERIYFHKIIVYLNSSRFIHSVKVLPWKDVCSHKALPKKWHLASSNLHLKLKQR